MHFLYGCSNDKCDHNVFKQASDPEGTGLLSLHAVKLILKDLSFQVKGWPCTKPAQVISDRKPVSHALQPFIEPWGWSGYLVLMELHTMLGPVPVHVFAGQIHSASALSRSMDVCRKGVGDSTLHNRVDLYLVFQTLNLFLGRLLCPLLQVLGLSTLQLMSIISQAPTTPVGGLWRPQGPEGKQAIPDEPQHHQRHYHCYHRCRCCHVIG